MQRRRAAAADPLVGRPAAGRQAQWPPRPYTDIMILENKKSKWGRQGPGRALCQRHHSRGRQSRCQSRRLSARPRDGGRTASDS